MSIADRIFIVKDLLLKNLYLFWFFSVSNCILPSVLKTLSVLNTDVVINLIFLFALFSFQGAVPKPCGLGMVGLGRPELPTSRLSGVRSNLLSYRPEANLNIHSAEIEVSLERR